MASFRSGTGLEFCDGAFDSLFFFMTFAYIPSKSFEGLFFGLIAFPLANCCPEPSSFPPPTAIFSRDVLYSMTDAAEFRPEDDVATPITVCDELFELIEVRFELLNWKLDPAPGPPPPETADWCLSVFGVGGRGELAWRFSGLGEPRLPTELVQLELDAWREWAYAAAECAE
uniref:(northern house mosquito) hypothetical protein n=1 Tax=Culex pipiens TaxID=7175 RepID=A0A8D8CSF3_CULPI